MNSLTANGRLASDVTLETTDSGRKRASFRFAAQTKRKDKDGKYIANFYSVTAWGMSAEYAATYLKKGYRATISGELTIRPYTGTDGQQRFSNDLEANTIDLNETKAESEAKSADTMAPATTAAPAASSGGFTAVETDELPF